MKLNKEIIIAVILASLISIVVNVIIEETGIKDKLRKGVRNEL
jgi:hypothetical protein